MNLKFKTYFQSPEPPEELPEYVTTAPSPSVLTVTVAVPPFAGVPDSSRFSGKSGAILHPSTSCF